MRKLMRQWCVDKETGQLFCKDCDVCSDYFEHVAEAIKRGETIEVGKRQRRLWEHRLCIECDGPNDCRRCRPVLEDLREDLAQAEDTIRRLEIENASLREELQEKAEPVPEPRPLAERIHSPIKGGNHSTDTRKESRQPTANEEPPDDDVLSGNIIGDIGNYEFENQEEFDTPGAGPSNRSGPTVPTRATPFQSRGKSAYRGKRRDFKTPQSPLMANNGLPVPLGKTGEPVIRQGGAWGDAPRWVELKLAIKEKKWITERRWANLAKDAAATPSDKRGKMQHRIAQAYFDWAWAGGGNAPSSPKPVGINRPNESRPRRVKKLADGSWDPEDEWAWNWILSTGPQPKPARRAWELALRCYFLNQGRFQTNLDNKDVLPLLYPKEFIRVQDSGTDAAQYTDDMVFDTMLNNGLRPRTAMVLARYLAQPVIRYEEPSMPRPVVRLPPPKTKAGAPTPTREESVKQDEQLEEKGKDESPDNAEGQEPLEVDYGYSPLYKTEEERAEAERLSNEAWSEKASEMCYNEDVQEAEEEPSPIKHPQPQSPRAPRAALTTSNTNNVPPPVGDMDTSIIAPPSWRDIKTDIENALSVHAEGATPNIVALTAAASAYMIEEYHPRSEDIPEDAISSIMEIFHFTIPHSRILDELIDDPDFMSLLAARAPQLLAAPNAPPRPRSHAGQAGPPPLSPRPVQWCPGMAKPTITYALASAAAVGKPQPPPKKVSPLITRKTNRNRSNPDEATFKPLDQVPLRQQGAAVVEHHNTICQASGHKACIVAVTWSRAGNLILSPATGISLETLRTESLDALRAIYGVSFHTLHTGEVFGAVVRDVTLCYSTQGDQYTVEELIAGVGRSAGGARAALRADLSHLSGVHEHTRVQRHYSIAQIVDEPLNSIDPTTLADNHRLMQSAEKLAHNPDQIVVSLLVNFVTCETRDRFLLGINNSHKIQMRGLRYTTSAFKPPSTRVVQCIKCWQLGHWISTCPAVGKVCGICTSTQHSKEEHYCEVCHKYGAPCQHKAKLYINCKGDHPTYTMKWQANVAHSQDVANVLLSTSLDFHILFVQEPPWFPTVSGQYVSTSHPSWVTIYPLSPVPNCESSHPRVLTYINHNLTNPAYFRSRPDIMNSFNAQVVDIHIRPNKVRAYNLYWEGKSHQQMIDKFDAIDLHTLPSLFLGDFNACHRSWAAHPRNHCNAAGTLIRSWIDLNLLRLLNPHRAPTFFDRCRGIWPSCIDLVLANPLLRDTYNPQVSIGKVTPFADHARITTELHFAGSSIPEPLLPQFSRHLQKDVFEATLAAGLATHHVALATTNQDLNQVALTLMTVLAQAAKASSPKPHKGRKRKTWWNKTLAKLSRSVDRA
ncbi:hypothetical protein BOTBODRAFT_179099 [Botryobasidium botryosum FD-172 SS1]|uniref:Endonuclease/exonuclease/phosphatase domain-containing protein n=1 Tax=Botryobasidium botryosum (strain FD-172 SS1) TaxID=930990 RepID=A0A067MCU8_BOTB1|nr:hypothetical protein BOTBODRAFT_179099 [Botryobasidium botryosum FD-172 SS1]